MKCLDFEWQINEFMVYCRSTQLREKSIVSYEQPLRLFEHWCADELRIFTVDKVTEDIPLITCQERMEFVPTPSPLCFFCRKSCFFVRRWYNKKNETKEAQLWKQKL